MQNHGLVGGSIVLYSFVGNTTNGGVCVRVNKPDFVAAI